MLLRGELWPSWCVLAFVRFVSFWCLQLHNQSRTIKAGKQKKRLGVIDASCQSNSLQFNDNISCLWGFITRLEDYLASTIDNYFSDGWVINCISVCCCWLFSWRGGKKIKILHWLLPYEKQKHFDGSKISFSRLKKRNAKNYTIQHHRSIFNL